MMRNFTIKIIRIYQEFISPGLGCNCRFYPSCSSYALEAVKKEGLLKGLAKGAWRILRCNPFNKGGIDLP